MTQIKSGIYKLTNKISNKVYIGSAVDLKARKRRHFKALSKGTHKNSVLQASYNFHSQQRIIKPEEIFIFEVIEYVEDLLQLEDKEQYYIDQYFDNQKKCYNICKKAGSWLGNKHSVISKQKISNNNPRTRKVEQWSLDGVYIQTFKNAFDASSNFREIKTVAIYNCIQKNNSCVYGFQWKFEGSNKIITKYIEFDKSIKIYQYSLDGKFISEHKSLNKASKNTNLNISAIHSCVNGKDKSCGGFLWSYEKKETIPAYIDSSVRKVSKIDKNTNEVLKTYNSIKEAAKDIGMTAPAISACCKGKQKTVGGFKWKYA